MKRFIMAFVLALFVITGVLYDAMPSYGACDAAVTNVAKGLALSGGLTATRDYRIALYTQAAASLDADTKQYTTSGELATANGYTQGDKALSSWAVAVDFTNNVAYLDWADASWTSSSITADCYMIFIHDDLASECTAENVPYDCCTGSSAGAECSNPAVLVGTFTSTTSTNGTFTVVMPAAAYNTAILRLQ
jgi:hypothetical protein